MGWYERENLGATDRGWTGGHRYKLVDEYLYISYIVNDGKNN